MDEFLQHGYLNYSNNVVNLIGCSTTATVRQTGTPENTFCVPCSIKNCLHLLAMGKETVQPDQNHVSGQSNKSLSRPAHALTCQELAEELNADPLNGLSADDAKRRLEEFGKNDLGEAEGVQPLKIVMAQIANAMTLVGVSISIDR